jgi:glutamate formiminotransferase / 5-formyltetrahydrofolate cyclo-ligase
MIIEAIPNVSQGRQLDLVAAFAEAIRAVPGVRLLNHSADPSHNRSVYTLVGDAPMVERAILALTERAVSSIDLRTHRGVHPRIGAVDVVPFVPIADATMADCIALAHRVGREIADRFDVPVFLYEEASTRPWRKHLEDIRRGQFEGLAAKLAASNWAPDFGAAVPHPTAGATVVGARMPLIAYNINLNTDRLDVARSIARTVRFSSGGLRFVKAMGVPLEHLGVVQVSMNLTNYEQTPMRVVFDAVKHEAETLGVSVLESELIGLVPAAALTPETARHIQLAGFNDNQIIENRLKIADQDRR